MENLAHSIKTTIYERTASPLFATFSLSWAIWNYQFLVTVFSSMDVPEKFSYIENVIYACDSKALIWLFIGPLVTSIAFIFIYPYPAKIVFKFWRKRQKELRDLRVEIEGNTLLTEDESRKIRSEIFSLQDEYESRISSNHAQISKLKSEIGDKNSMISDLKEELKRIKFLGEQRARQGMMWSPLDQESSISLEDTLRSQPFRLIFNPAKGQAGSKIIIFGSSGKIIEGQNQNEHSWRIKDGKLELIQADGQVHSRFNHLTDSGLFVHTNDPDTKSIRGQVIIPDPESAGR